MKYIFLVTVAFVLIYLIKLVNRKKIKKIKMNPKRFQLWNEILEKEVRFFHNLNNNEKDIFLDRVLKFLNSVKVTPVNVEISESDKLLIGASAIIPVFAFPKWEYLYLDEIIVYQSSFNERYDTNSKDNNILGMVGSGVMSNTMILSLKALRHGFENERDKMNTAIHEFVHLIDKQDGIIDGVPSALLESNYIVPWLELINKEIDDITNDKSDIRDYGAYNKSEFFSIASEYFFERPILMERKHPELFKFMNRIYDRTPKMRRAKKRK